VLEERPRTHAVLGALIDPEGGGGVHGRLNDTVRPEVLRGVGALVGVPQVYAGEVPAEARVEHYLRQKTVLPLGVEEVVELLDGAPWS